MGIIILLLILGIAAGIIGALTGAGMSKIWRRMILPGITTIIGIISLWSIMNILLMLRSIVLSIGYGIPDPQSQAEPRDKGSFLGRFWWRIFTKNGQAESAKNMKNTGIATRGTIGFLEGLSILSIPFIVGTVGAWALWFWALAFLCINNILFGEIIKGEGTIKLFGKELLWEEILIHGIDTVIITVLILLCR